MYRSERSPAEVPLCRFIDPKAACPQSAQLQPLLVFVLVPHGEAKDPTRPPAFYDETYEFLVSCGMPELK